MDGQHWTDVLREEAEGARTNGRVGHRLVSETEQYRVWLIDLAPGERIGFHTHVLDYFWVATSGGRARSRHADGRVVEVDYDLGDVRHMAFAAGESMTHDLENIGDTRLTFTTVEDKRSVNAPLPL
jgi:hypothetical protein